MVRSSPRTALRLGRRSAGRSTSCSIGRGRGISRPLVVHGEPAGVHMPSLLRIVPLAQRRLGLLEQGQSPVLPGDPEPPPGVVEQMLAARRPSLLFALPVFGEWPGWMTVLVVALLLPPVMRLIDRHPVDEDDSVVEHPSRRHVVDARLGRVRDRAAARARGGAGDRAR